MTDRDSQLFPQERPRVQPAVRLATLAALALAFVALQVGLIPLPSTGGYSPAGEVRSAGPGGTLVFTSTSVVMPEFTSTATVVPDRSSPTASATVRPSPTRRPRPTATPTATSKPRPTRTPTRAPHLATIDYFVADRTQIYAGDTIVLSWDLHDAEEAYLLFDGREEGVVAPGDKVFTLTQTTAFTLSAHTHDGKVNQSLLITVFPVTVTPTAMPTPDGAHRTAQVPILMYHYISKPPKGADIYRLDLSVAPENFEAHLAWLRSQGYHGITLRDLVYHLTLGWPLPDKPIILTFDDGYRDNYTNAFPLLEKYGYVGTFFVLTSPIDDGDPNYLTWDMVKEMHQAGMQLQPHGYHHYDLKGKSVDQLVYEIVGAQQAIEARTGEMPRFFSYPAGSYDRETIAVLKSAQFWAAVTTIQGTTQSSGALFELQRLRVRGETTVEGLAQVLGR